MDLNIYLKQKRGRAAALARAIGVFPPDVCNWAQGKKPIPFHYGAAIEMATDALVTRQEMFPNDWQRLWPELAGKTKRRRSDMQTA